MKKVDNPGPKGPGLLWGGLMKKQRKGKKQNKKLRKGKQISRTPEISLKKRLQKFVDSGEYTFWLVHGLNYLASSYEDGIWQPPFEGLYQGLTYTSQEILSVIKSEPYMVKENPTSAGLILGGWAALGVEGTYAFKNEIVRKAKTNTKTPKVLKGPYNEITWKSFNQLKQNLINKQEREIFL